MTSELSRLQSLLNREEILPATGYRRNKVIFELVTYVNCLIGCVLSERRDAVPLFVRRCRAFLKDNAPAGEFDSYYASVRSYIAQVEQAFGAIPDE